MRLATADFFRSLVLVIFSCIAFVAMDARAASPTTRPIAADASESQFWIIEPDADSSSNGQILRVSSIGPTGDGSWQRMAGLRKGAADLAYLAGRAVVVFSDGSWAYAWDRTTLAGASLPEDRRAVAVGGGETGLWFIASPPGSKGTTQSSDAPDLGLALIRYERDRWTTPVSLPEHLSRAVEIDVVGDPNAAVVAARVGGQIVLARWAGGEVSALPAIDADLVRQFRLIGSAGVPMVWIESLDGSQFVVSGTRRTQLRLPAIGEISAATATLIGGELRLIARASDGKSGAGQKLWTQIYNAEFEPVGQPREIRAVAAVPPPTRAEHLLNYLALATLGVALLLFGRAQRVNPLGEPIKSPRPAGLFRRLVAGILDGIFLWGAPLGIVLAGGVTMEEGWPVLTSRQEIIVVGALVLHVISNLIFELNTGTSPGKRLMRMKVAMIDGSPPTRKALIIRNLLRVLDSQFIVLLTIPFTPLRQRVADFFAGTMVVDMDDAVGERHKGSTDE